MKDSLNLNQMSEKITALFKGDKKIKLIVLAGILGILFIFLSGGKTENVQKKSNETVSSSFSAEELSVQMEKKLTALVGGISGVGHCNVMITYENGIEYVYANESKSTSDVMDEGEGGKKQEKNSQENSLVIIDTGNGKEALRVKEIQPKVRGVVVVCDGADNISVRQRVVDAVTTALDISSAKVYVAKAIENK